MKYFPVKIVFLCIILTPLLYIGSLSYLERYLGPVYKLKVENHIIGDSGSLLDGSIRIQDAVYNNIKTFLQKDLLISRFGLDLDILVTAKNGLVLFPHLTSVDSELGNGQGDPVAIARKNYEIMDRGLDVIVVSRLRHGTLGANLLLLFFLIPSLSLCFLFYKKGSDRATIEDREKGERISALLEDEKAYRRILKDLELERRNLFESLKTVNKNRSEDKKRATLAEEEMFEELISLEDKLKENIELQQKKEQEVLELKEALKKHERRKDGGAKRKNFDFMVKRFAALYKNIDIHKKALRGFSGLEWELQIKAEEIIHQLNEDVAGVTIKRKVFSVKKHKASVFEILFAYNGRLYFRNLEGGRIQVLVIGTKNTQDKDMEFLHSL